MNKKVSAAFLCVGIGTGIAFGASKRQAAKIETPSVEALNFDPFHPEQYIGGDSSAVVARNGADASAVDGQPGAIPSTSVDTTVFGAAHDLSLRHASARLPSESKGEPEADVSKISLDTKNDAKPVAKIAVPGLTASDEAAAKDLMKSVPATAAEQKTTQGVANAKSTSAVNALPESIHNGAPLKTPTDAIAQKAPTPLALGATKSPVLPVAAAPVPANAKSSMSSQPAPNEASTKAPVVAGPTLVLPTVQAPSNGDRDKAPVKPPFKTVSIPKPVEPRTPFRPPHPIFG